MPAVPVHGHLPPPPALLFRLDPEAGHASGIGRPARRPGPAAARAPRLRGRYLVDDPPLRQTLFGRELPEPGRPRRRLRQGRGRRPRPGRPRLRLRRGRDGHAPAPAGQSPAAPVPATPRPRACRTPWGSTTRGMEALRRPARAALPARRSRSGSTSARTRRRRRRRRSDDYETLIRGLADLGDYLVVNLSSPNTPGLRDLQNEAFVRAVLGAGRRRSRPSRCW